MVDQFDNPELQLLGRSTSVDTLLGGGRLQHELQNAPLFTYGALEKLPQVFQQRGLLGSVVQQQGNGFPTVPHDKRLYVNTSAPCSAVVCGVQGSGKSHTVSCLLECSLIADNRIGELPESLAGIVFHFDEDNGDRPCEAAFLATPRQDVGQSCSAPEVTVLVSPSNLRTRRKVYAELPNVNVQPLYLSEANLNAGRMLSMMGCDDIESMPLYMLTALSVLRSMGSDDFDYKTFKERLEESEFNPAQRSMFKMRTDLLDSYLSNTAANITSWFGQGKLVVIDLSDPFLDGPNAAILFDIVLGIFVEWRSPSRRNKKIIVLDEAHKYLGTQIGARFTKTISSLIRQQRHLGLRIIISTQEPTVIPTTILDLSSYIICHRFSAPSWCTYLKRHVSLDDGETHALHWTDEVMRLHTGEALVFSPNSVTVKTDDSSDGIVARLGVGYLKIMTRPRITLDGGFSIMAMDSRTTSPPYPPRIVNQPLPTIPTPGARNGESSRSADLAPISKPSCPTPPKTPDLPKPSTAESNSGLNQASSVNTRETYKGSRFADLVQILRESRTAGVNIMRGSVIAEKLLRRRPNIFKETGFNRWKEYIGQAETLGIVRITAATFVELVLDIEDQQPISGDGATSDGNVINPDGISFQTLVDVLNAFKAASSKAPRRSKVVARLEQISPAPGAGMGFNTWSDYIAAAASGGYVNIIETTKKIRLSLP